MNFVKPLRLKMIEFDRGDAKRIQHFLKVHDFAAMIADGEGLDEKMKERIECAALVHDIGIHPAEAKYGSCSGKYQELEGPIYARPMLEELGMPQEEIDRICYLVGHHHTYKDIDGVDYQILVEADFLVNLYEDGVSADGIAAAKKKIFRTETGCRLCELNFGV